MCPCSPIAGCAPPKLSKAGRGSFPGGWPLPAAREALLQHKGCSQFPLMASQHAASTVTACRHQSAVFPGFWGTCPAFDREHQVSKGIRSHQTQARTDRSCEAPRNLAERSGSCGQQSYRASGHLQAPRCSPVEPAQIALDPLAESLPILGHAHQAVLEIVREIPCRDSRIGHVCRGFYPDVVVREWLL